MPQMRLRSDHGISVFELYLVSRTAAVHRGPSFSSVAHSFFQLNRAKAACRQRHLERWQSTASETMTGRPIDAILCPVAPYTAPLHGTGSTIAYSQYCSVYNLLDWPAISFPVTFVDPAVDPSNAGYDALSELDQSFKDSYDPVGSAGEPVGLQLVGQSYREERLLGVTEAVMKAYRAAGHSHKA